MIIERGAARRSKLAATIKIFDCCEWKRKKKMMTFLSTTIPNDDLASLSCRVVAGHPKCGTTTLVANLANIAPMRVESLIFVRTMRHNCSIAYTKNDPTIIPTLRSIPTNNTFPTKSYKTIIEVCTVRSQNKVHYSMGIRHPMLWGSLRFRIWGAPEMSTYSRMKLCLSPHAGSKYGNFSEPTKRQGIQTSRPRNIISRRLSVHRKVCRPSLLFSQNSTRMHIPLVRAGKLLYRTKNATCSPTTTTT